MDNREKKSKDQEVRDTRQEQGRIGNAGTEGTQAYNNINESKPIGESPAKTQDMGAESHASQKS